MAVMRNKPIQEAGRVSNTSVSSALEEHCACDAVGCSLAIMLCKVTRRSPQCHKHTALYMP